MTPSRAPGSNMLSPGVADPNESPAPDAQCAAPTAPAPPRAMARIPIQNEINDAIGQSAISIFMLVAALTVPYWAVPLWTPDTDASEKHHKVDHEHGTLTFHLTLSWHLLISWCFGRCMICLRGPPQLGYIVAGFLLRFYCHPAWVLARPTIQMLAFLIVLVRAGLEISPQDLDLVTVLLGTLPVVADALAIAKLSMWVWDVPFMTGCVLGKGKGKVLGRSPNSSVTVIPTCPSQHPFRLAGSQTL